MRVLCADDDRVWQRIVAKYLSKWGYTCVPACNGEQALSALEKDDGPLLAILDWEMPLLSGVEVCKQLRKTNRHGYIYILLVTGKNSNLDIVEGLRAGADDYITKPIRVDELERRLESGRRIVDLEKSLIDSREHLKVEMRERERVETELRHGQKMEAVGQLAAGLAHEINTPIQFVGDSVHFLEECVGVYKQILARYREVVKKDEVVRARLQELEEELDIEYFEDEAALAVERSKAGVERVCEVISAMRRFAWEDNDEFVASDINRIIEDMLIVTRNEYRYVAEVITDFGEIPFVDCQPGDIGQVLLNMVVNASHAIMDMQGEDKEELGEIRISTRWDEAAGTVIIRISDTGCGIEEKNKNRIFDPFFTTKEVGRGTGQGLALSHAVIVERHRGIIELESEIGKGTCFHISLPTEARAAA